MRIRNFTNSPNGPPPRLSLKAASPGVAGNDEDCNSNTSLAGSQNSSHDDLDPTCDNSEYLWFLEFTPHCMVFRDGSRHHTSVLSSVSASYKGISDLTSRFEFTSRYNDIARDLDANLAEADMESFKTEDIHALLMTNLPQNAVTGDQVQESNPRGEMFASISSSIMEKFRFDSSLSLSANSSYQGEESVGSINTMSICKSELLFSPLKECAQGVHFSVDSLDCELPTERDLILTCQANKDNYTIAFEGSLTTYSEDSECIEPAVNKKRDKLDNTSETVQLSNDERTRRNLELLERCKTLTNKLTMSMARSDLGLTTWSKLKKQNNQSPLRRHPSGNNNEGSRETTVAATDMNNSVIKSQSLPNLYKRKIMNSSINSNGLSNSTVDSFTTNQRKTGTPTCIKLYDVSQQRSLQGSQHSEPMSTSSTENQISLDRSQQKQSFNLVKLYMKQKSNDGISMDQMDKSECWPSISGGDSSDSIGDRKIINIKSIEHSQVDDSDECRKSPHNNRVYDDVLIEEDETFDCSRSNDSDTNVYATVNKPFIKRVNTNTNSRIKNNKKSSSSQSSTSVSISSCSESDGTQITRMNRIFQKECNDNKTTSTHLEIETIDKSMQTSIVQINTCTLQERELIKGVETSFLTKLKEGDCEKPVYVLYPNYTLPDISFLNGRANIYLNPVKVNVGSKSNDNKKINMQVKNKRPFSCNDVEMLRKKGLNHIKDWDSLNFLLPKECKQLLSGFPELAEHLSEREGMETNCDKFNETLPDKPKARPLSCDCNNLTVQNTAVSSSSSTATQPSSGYRGSSTMLTESTVQNVPIPNYNPLFVYRYDSATSSDASCVNNECLKMNPITSKRSYCLENKVFKQSEVAPPRPPLPKSILRKTRENTKRQRNNLFEMEEFEEESIVCMAAEAEFKNKKASVPNYLANQEFDYKINNDLAARRLYKKFLDAADKDADYNEYYQDEGVGTESSLESGKSNEIKLKRLHTPPRPKPRTKRVEYAEFPPPGALISSADLQLLEEFLKQSGFSCKNMDEWDQTQMQKAKNLAEIPGKEDRNPNPLDYNNIIHHQRKGKVNSMDLSHKRALVSNVTDAVELFIHHFAPAGDQAELAFLGDSKQSPACAKLALNSLCPALYAVFRDGLKENIETSFGTINNSVWLMVEALTKQDPITKSLHELVLRINSEDAITEGLVKFNAFIMGLLNTHSVDAWVSYVRTRESLLAKHYSSDSLLLTGCIGEPHCRGLLDTLLTSLEVLRLLPFNLDIMFEMRELHKSFKKIENDLHAASQFDGSGEELRPESAGSCGSGKTANTSNNSGGGKFRKLQLKWEMLSNAESPVSPSGDAGTMTARSSKIPRPVTSPVRPQTTPTSAQAKNIARGIPVLVRKTATVRNAPASTNNGTTKKTLPLNRHSSVCTNKENSKISIPRRFNNSKQIPIPTSRVDRTNQGAVPRPSSLPYGRAVAPRTTRRACSSSATRVPQVATQQKHRYVRTLWHRLPSDSGHLAFSEGERLRLILEVDEQYVLCCRGEQKGLVPREAILIEDF